MRPDVSRLFRATVRPRFRSLTQLPGPAPVWPWGNAWHFARRFPWEVLAKLAEREARLFVVWILNQPLVVLNDPELVGEVLEHRPDEFYKADPVAAFRPLTPGGSLFIANGEQWRGLRDHDPYHRVDQPRLQASQSARWHQLVRNWTTSRIEAPPPRDDDATRLLQRLAFDCFALFVWGETCDEQTYRDFNRMGHEGARRVSVPPLALVPPLDPRFYTARNHWNQTFDERVARARQDTAPDRHDLLHVTLRQPTTLNDETLRVALASMFYGGVYSVTSAVVSTLDCLSHHEPFARLVRDELRARLPGEDGGDPVELDQCPHLDAALRESLRLLTPVPVFLRNVRPDRSVMLAGHTLPGDTPIVIAPWLFHRAASHWDEATEFRPERWLHGAREANPLGSDYFFPFGRGPRACVAQSFGWFAMKRLLASLLLSADVTTTGTWRASFYFGVQMPRGLKVRVRR